MSEPAAKVGTVSRFAWLAGWAAGVGICVGGYYVVPAFDLPIGGAPALELLVVAVAFAVTFGIWKLSANASRRDLDTPAADRDRGAP